MRKKQKLFVPDRIPEHERPLGRMLADSEGAPFHALRSLKDAQADPHGYVILQGDSGGQIYLVAPASYIRCSSETLNCLLRDLDQIAWPGNDDDMRQVYFERLSPGSVVSGGMGGGVANADPWIHPEFVSKGLRPAILSVLRGEHGTIH